MTAVCFNIALAAAQDAPKAQTEAEQSSSQIQIPINDSPEYWNIRSEAISELLPLLTKKRSEVKSKQQVLVSYLEKNDMFSAFTAKNVPVPTDPNIYFDILQIGQGLEEMNMPRPKKRPSWDEIMDVAMKHVVFEGYVPTHVEEGEDLSSYVEICEKKEQYGHKVRRDLKSVVDQCARMWVYLDSVGKLNDVKSYYADLKTQQETQRAQEKAQYVEAHREAVMQQNAQAKQQKFEDEQARAQFHSSRQQQAVESRQTRLNSRAANSGIYIY